MNATLAGIRRILNHDPFWILGITVVNVALYSDVLIFGNSTPHPTSDGYFTFHFFNLVAGSIRQGFLPYWDQLTGSPVYLTNAIMNIYDPLIVLIAFVGRFFTEQNSILFMWKFYLLAWTGALGLYFLMKNLTNDRRVGIAAFAIFLFSSAFYSIARQPSLGAISFVTPWILHYFIQLFEKPGWRPTFGFAFFSSWGFQGYTTVFNGMVLLLFVLTLLVTNRRQLLELLKRRNWGYFAFILGVNVLAMSSTASLFFDMGEVSMGVGRSSTFADYDVIKLGTHAGFWDFFGLISPQFSSLLYLLHGGVSNMGSFNNFSESFLYIGLLPMALAVIGMIWSRSPYKFNLIVLLALTSLLSFGDKTWVHRIFFYLVPPFQMARHMHLLNTINVVLLTCLSALGFKVVFEQPSMQSLKRVFSIILGMFVMTQVGLGLIPSISVQIPVESLVPRIQFLRLISYLVFGFVVLSIPVFLSPFLRLRPHLKLASFLMIVAVELMLVVDPILDTPGEEARMGFGPHIFQRKEENPLTNQFTDYRASFFKIKSQIFLEDLQIDPVARHMLFVDRLTEYPSPINMPTTRLYPRAESYPMPDIREFLRSTKNHGVLRNLLRTLLLQDSTVLMNHRPVALKPITTNDPETDQALFESYSVPMEWTPNRLRFYIHAPNPSYLLWAQNMHKHWRAYVDRANVPIHRAFLGMPAIEIPSGTHEVTFQYKPHLFRALLLSYYVVFSLLIFLLAVPNNFFPKFASGLGTDR